MCMICKFDSWKKCYGNCVGTGLLGLGSNAIQPIPMAQMDMEPRRQGKPTMTDFPRLVKDTGLLYFDYKIEIEILQAQMDSFVAAFAPSLRGRGASEPTRATVHRNPISASVLSEGKYLLTCFPSVSFELFCITSFCFHFASRRTLHQLIVLLNWCKQIICLCSLQSPP